ncbi:MAG: hypothetical protein JRI80_10115 [Deltaproteobacteria bacterium]|nr:hypothetical protein [Deltaproteobacteria bacterium]
MSVLDRIEKRAIRDLLGKGWLTHDGMWFYHIYKEFGIESANVFNKAAIKSLAPIEMKRMKRVLGVAKENFDTFDELTDFLFAALELTLPDSVFKRAHFSAPSSGLIHWVWERGQCFAYKGMKQIGAIDGYRCGVLYRIGCWLEALGVTCSMHPKIDGCLMHENGACEGEFRVFLHG